MEQNKFLNNSPEQVVIYPKPRIIKIQNACAERAYGLFDSVTGTQVGEFKKGTTGQVEFDNLEPSRQYDVGAIEGMGDEKPQFALNWTARMKDDTDEILKNSGNLPVVFPCTYHIIDNGSNNVFDLVDNNGERVGQVMKLSPAGDKPEIRSIWSLKVKDDTKE